MIVNDFKALLSTLKGGGILLDDYARLVFSLLIALGQRRAHNELQKIRG